MIYLQQNINSIDKRTKVMNLLQNEYLIQTRRMPCYEQFFVDLNYNFYHPPTLHQKIEQTMLHVQYQHPDSVFVNK